MFLDALSALNTSVSEYQEASQQTALMSSNHIFLNLVAHNAALDAARIKTEVHSFRPLRKHGFSV